MSVSVCWFRRNLRLDDNLPLDAALRSADAVVPVFVLDDHFLEEDFSPPRLAVVAASLKELDADLRRKGSRLVVRNGPPEAALAALVRETGATAVFAPRDHEPHAKRQDARVASALSSKGARLELREDFLLVPAPALVAGSGKPYTVYTPFAKRWLEFDKPLPVAEPARIPSPPAILAPAFPSIPLTKPRGFRERGAPENPAGGARAARRLWDAFRRAGLPGYAAGRDRPDLPGTSRLSPHLRFGTIGIRRLFAEAGEARRDFGAEGRRSVETFVKELVWREFYAGILDNVPRVETACFRSAFEEFPWTAGEEADRRFAAWSAGRTGYPIVDAGMRQLQREGWMHNRVRMIVASFLTKDLLVDWRRGERFFRRHLADGDPASNNGGWQWAAGCGTDAQPFFRIFNPVLQGERFDPDGAYVRRYVPELEGLTSSGRKIHAPWALPRRPDDYPAPIVDHRVARDAALAAFARIARVC